MPFTAEELNILGEVYAPDVITLYFAWFFNLILWVCLWLLCKAVDHNPMPALAAAGLFVLVFPRSWLEWLHEHDHVRSLPMYPFSLIGLALLTSILPWIFIVYPAMNENDVKVRARNEEIRAESDIRNSESAAVKEEDNVGDILRQRKVRGHIG
mmetsp:Transcript_13076/g.41250  ORF Transcript_13076/g.41250 Transcript_13076/m.41250 type:complete len:154 (-) Transcript_13076:202-663(-)